MTTEEALMESAALVIQEQRDKIRRLEGVIEKYLPDYGTPNWCPKCSPKRLGYCQCEIACNE